MVNEEILRLLRSKTKGFLSGEEISRTLGLTRTAVWKRIGKLRDSGYVIKASTRSGYCLTQSPDLLLPSEIRPFLETKWMGKKIHYFETIESTNSVAYQLASKGAGEGELVIAESQEKGRGRLGRPWVSPPFLNLYLSAILRPNLPPHRASLITFMAAVAAADAIEKCTGLQPVIKWPNDLLLKNRKVAGLLNEIHSETDRIHFVVLGMGVNINMQGRFFPRELRAKATSLKRELGRPVSRRDFACCLIRELERWYEIFMKEGGGPVLTAWRDRARIKGKEVTVTSFGEVLGGNAVDVDSDGALILRIKGGEQKRIVAGDVEYR